MSRVIPHGADRVSVTEYIVLTLRFSKFPKAVLYDIPATMTPVSRVTGDNDTRNLHTSLTRDFRGVETELQLRWMGKSTNERGPSLVGSMGSLCQGTRDLCSALAALIGPVQFFFFLTLHYFNSSIPIAQQARQASVLGRLSLSMCLWTFLYAPSGVV